MWLINVSNPDIQKKINTKRADFCDPTWSAKGDTLLFYLCPDKYFATDYNKNIITSKRYKKLVDFKLTVYKKIKKGVYPAIKDCKIVMVDSRKML